MVGPDRARYWDDMKQPEVYSAPWPAITLNDTRDTRVPKQMGVYILAKVRAGAYKSASQAADRLG